MLTMILKMSAVTALYVLLTALIWKRRGDKKLALPAKLVIGVIYGLCAVLSTHFGVDYGDMMLNVRDIGPLAAGLFFHPLSGILAGLIGGIERYIAGTWWGVGSYTRIACSVSTCLAGFVSALWSVWIFKRKKPSAIYAFFMGAVMEVFHMYVVFITHRNDMSMALHVVKTCAVPMIVFTGLGMAAASTALRMLAGEWKNPFRHMRQDEVPVSQTFQFWLFAVTMAILLVNFALAYAVQTQTALQEARDTVADVSEDIRQTYVSITSVQSRMENYAEELVLTDAQAIAKAVEGSDTAAGVDAELLASLRGIYNLQTVSFVRKSGTSVLSTGDAPIYVDMLSDVLNGKADSKTARASDTWILAGARCLDGMIETVINPKAMMSTLGITSLNDALTYFHVGSEGTFDILRSPSIIMLGAHRGAEITPEDRQLLTDAAVGESFQAELFGVKSLCRLEKLDDALTLLVQLPMSEVFAGRDAHAYETALADILLFTVIYVLISMLVQQIVVNNLQLVNASLDKITGGDLNEVVAVRNSSEFASLSDDINQTVDVLKGYIEAAEKRIEQELEFAFTIQDSALPKNFDFPRGDFRLFASMDPAKEVGGDFYDFFFVDQNHLALVIADVSGKGIPASLFMMRAKTAIRGFADSAQSPAEILYRANNTLCEGNDAEMFVTVWLGIINLETGVMRCANAGHEYPAIMRAGGDYELLKDRHGLALAAMEGVHFKEYELAFNPGDRLFVYTDGVPEAIDEQVEQYGTNRMLRVLNAEKGGAMRELLPIVRKDIADFAGGAEQFDDITMLGFAYFGAEGGRKDEGTET